MSLVSNVLVVGAGLMGASVGLAARDAGMNVRILDKDAEHVSAASKSTGLEVCDSDFIPDLVVIATPPEQTALEVSRAIRMFPSCTVIDIASIKTQVLNEVDTNFEQISRFVPTHPMAGKETSGFEYASFDLFRDRIWVVCPLATTDPSAVDLVKRFIVSLGALPFEMSALEHDRTVALTSHVPQVVASVLAAQLLDLRESHVQVSGQGLRDMTRIASSNPQLWSEILLANAEFVGPLVAKISSELALVAQSLSSGTAEHIASAMTRGNQGRSLVPGKHGDKPALYETVSIMIQDAPGQLAAIFAVAGQVEVNVEDVRIDHALGKAVAVIELDVDPANAPKLREALRLQGWTLRNTPRT